MMPSCMVFGLILLLYTTGIRCNGLLTGTITNTPKSSYHTIDIVLSNTNYTYTAQLNTNAQFYIDNISNGQYLLNINSIEYSYSNYLVIIHNNEINDVQLLQQGEYYKSMRQPLTIAPVFPHIYYTDRVPFDLLSYCKNPMVIMMIITLLMVIVMPRMLNNMDPEELAQIKKAQKNYSLQGMMESLQGKVDANSNTNNNQQSQQRQRRVQ